MYFQTVDVGNWIFRNTSGYEVVLLTQVMAR